MYKARKVRNDDGASISDAQEVCLLFKQNFQVLEESCRWETHNVMEIPFDLADEHPPETLAQSLVIIGRTHHGSLGLPGQRSRLRDQSPRRCPRTRLTG
jgi:hypothetical protein